MPSKNYTSPNSSVAVIGMGYAGTWQTIYLLNNATQDMTIYEIEAIGYRRCGGIAYGECEPSHQVNLPPERQFGPHDNNQDYINWLNSADRSRWPQPFRDQIGDKKVTAGSGEFPRELFKLYSTDRLVEAKTKAEERGINVKTIPIDGCAVAIDESKNRPVITLADGNTIETDVWVVATGHGPAIVPPFMKGLSESERVVLDPWCKKTADRMAKRDKNERILYVGTGMTTYDLMIRDEAYGHTGKQVMMSRHGETHHIYDWGYVFKPAEVEIPEAFTKATNKDELLNGKPGEFEGALAVYKRLTSSLEEGGKGIFCEQVLAAWEKKIPALLERLPEADLSALFRNKTIANTKRIGVAPKVGEAIERARKRGMETWTGEIHSMTEKPDGVYVEMTRTDGGRFLQTTEKFDRVYSGLGMSNDFAVVKENDPLWHNIIDENKMTQPHRFGGVQAAENGKLPGAKRGYAVGMPLSGERVEKGFCPTISGAVVSIRGDLPGTTQAILSQLQAIRAERSSATSKPLEPRNRTMGLNR